MQSARLQLAIGQQRFYSADNPGALAAYRQAADADPLSPTIRQHIAQSTAYSLMQRKPSASGMETSVADEEISRIDAACTDFIRSDQRAISGKLTRARIYRHLYRLTAQSKYIDTSINDYRDVVRRHPTNAALWVERAACEEAAGLMDQARTSAARAAEIESVNQAWGHRDQFLSADSLTTIDRIIHGRTQ